MINSGESVITFPVAGGIFGIGRLTTKLNELVNAGQIGLWHVGEWTDFRHTAIQIRFDTVASGEAAKQAYAPDHRVGIATE